MPQKHETLPEIPHDTAFLCSPADVPGPRKVQLQDKDITTDIRQKFEELCDEYGEAFSKNNEDIGRTKLVKMDIDTGDSPPVSSRPYTLPLKHYEWVQREIESLEQAGVITKSMSKWASPIVIVPKKSAPGEPPKRRLCVDFRKVNKLQQEVITAGKTKGQISIHPLPKIDEMYAKLKGAKVFSTIDLRSGYHHIALGKSLRAKTTFVTPFDAQILLRSDHKPLEKFLLKNTLNSKVNNWAMELEAFNIQFDYIKGSNNILADTLSRLISIDPDTPTMPEELGYEVGYAIFEEFPKVTTKTYEVNEVIVGTNTEIFKNDPELQNSLQCIENPIAPQKLQKLQQQDTNIEILKRKLRNNRLDKEYYSLDENELLMRKVIDGGHEFCAIYLPSVLIFQVLRTAHDDLGHNGFPRTYAAIKQVFFWKGMKEDIRKHCKTCATCQLHKLENVKFERKIFKPSLQPMDFICMDLIGEFHPPTSCGHRYALTAVCMLTGFTWCVPLKTKTAEEVAKAYMAHIYCNFGGSIKILTDNGTEFKNKLFKEVVSKLGTEFSIHSPPYRPQSNGKIEGFHRFLKMCIGKHINYGLEWDELTPMATACYNFFPNCSARESAFFVMFGRDPINKLNMLLHAARRYFHDDNGLPNLEVLKNIYQVVAQQLLNSRERYVKKHHNQQ